MYDPTPGRWTTEDPIGFLGGDANLYRFVGNAPTNATDPTGEAADPVSPGEAARAAALHQQALSRLTTEEQAAYAKLQASTDPAVQQAVGFVRSQAVRGVTETGYDPDAIAAEIRGVLDRFDPVFKARAEQRLREYDQRNAAQRQLEAQASQAAEEAALPQARPLNIEQHRQWDLEADQAIAASRARVAAAKAELKKLLDQGKAANALAAKAGQMMKDRTARNEEAGFWNWRYWSPEKASPEERQAARDAALADVELTPKIRKLLAQLGRWEQIEGWDGETKLREAVTRAYNSGKLSAGVKESVGELLKGKNLAIMLGSMGFVGGLSATPAGPVIGGIAAGIGYVMFGKSVTDISRDYYLFVRRALGAVTDEDLDAAAAHFVAGTKAVAGEAGAAALGAGAGKVLHAGLAGAAATRRNLAKLKTKAPKEYPNTPPRSQRPATVEKIGDAYPRGSRWAGRTYEFQGVKDPKLRAALREKYPNGVQFDEKGFPDFSPYKYNAGDGKLNDVRIEMSGS